MQAWLRGSPLYLPIGSFALAAAIGGVLAMLRRQRVRISITKKRIKDETGPFLKQKEKIKWSEIASCEIIRTPPLAQRHAGNLHFSDESFISLAVR